jgi:Zn-dependent protease with chaperone function
VENGTGVALIYKLNGKSSKFSGQLGIKRMRIGKRLVFTIAAIISFARSADAVYFREGNRAERQEYSSLRDQQQLSRLRAIMLPLLRVTDHRMSPGDIRVSVVDDQAVNAASAGGGRFFVTTGLLNRATDDQLRGVLAHEIAHEDLGHPAKAQVIGAGLNIGVALLERLFPAAVRLRQLPAH